ncbi:MAG: hypothetical protein ACRC3Z_02550 [Phocaeicola sp.]
MKKTKLAVFVTALLSVFTLTSCLNGSNSTVYDIYEVVTVESYSGIPYLKGDGTNNIYNPATTSVLSSLLLKDGGYYKRAQVGIKLAEGEKLIDGMNKTYKIAEIQVYDYISYKTCNLRPDTLKAEKYELVNLEAGSSRVWAANKYVNIPFTFRTNTQLTADNFEVYAYKAVEDTLFLRFQQTKGSESSYSVGTGLISFEMPIYEAPFSHYYNQTIPSANDSIIIAVTALGDNGTEIKKTVQYKK